MASYEESVITYTLYQQQVGLHAQPVFVLSCIACALRISLYAALRFIARVAGFGNF